MKFNLINDDKLQIIISKEDMAQRDLRKWDLVPYNLEAQKLFQEILEEAHEACGFDVGKDAQLMIEAYPMTGESMLITVTKIMGKGGGLPLGFDVEEVGQRLINDLMDDMDLPDLPMKEAVFRFAQLEDVIQVAPRLLPIYDGSSQLLRFQDAYYLILPDVEEDWLDSTVYAVLSEFGTSTRTTAPFFQEHGQMVIAEDALTILAKL
jgi:adapter protein MecA 1/2